MRIRLAAIFILLASPAFAHHEVVTVVSTLPMVLGAAAFSVAGLAAWFRRVSQQSRARDSDA